MAHGRTERVSANRPAGGQRNQKQRVNSSVTKRSKTQGAANQTSRINCKSIAQAAAAQASAVAVTLACARAFARGHPDGDDGCNVANPMATNAANAATLWLMDVTGDSWDEVFALTMSSRLVFNASPTKLGAGCVMTVARKLARAELEDCAISERMGSANHMLEGVCKAITSPGEYQLDAVWASWVLVVYLCCHPEGRVLLRDTPLTDVDYQTAQAFEMYGRAEITPCQAGSCAAKWRRSQAQVAGGTTRGGQTGSPNAVMDVVDQIADEEQKTLATKRKRGAKGHMSASTSDSSGMLQWWYGALHDNCPCSSRSSRTPSRRREPRRRRSRSRRRARPQRWHRTSSSAASRNKMPRPVPRRSYFVGRRLTEMPALIAWSWRGKVVVVSRAPRAKLEPPRCTRATWHPHHCSQRRVPRCAWRGPWRACTRPRSDAYTVLPSLLERLQGLSSVAELQAWRAAFLTHGSDGIGSGAAPPHCTVGVTRSTISAAIKLCVNASQQQIGWELSNQLKTMPLSDTPIHHSVSVPMLRATEQNPVATRAPVLACHLSSPWHRTQRGVAHLDAGQDA